MQWCSVGEARPKPSYAPRRPCIKQKCRPRKTKLQPWTTWATATAEAAKPRRLSTQCGHGRRVIDPMWLIPPLPLLTPLGEKGRSDNLLSPYEKYTKLQALNHQARLLKTKAGEDRQQTQCHKQALVNTALLQSVNKLHRLLAATAATNDGHQRHTRPRSHTNLPWKTTFGRDPRFAPHLVVPTTRAPSIIAK